MTIYTTLNEIREHSPCSEGWAKLLKNLDKTHADDEPLALQQILDSNGLDDALWALRAVKGHDKELRLFACQCARLVLPIYEKQYPDDNRPRKAIEAAEAFALGRISKADDAAYADADDAAYAAYTDAYVDAAYTDAYVDAAADACAAAATYTDAEAAAATYTDAEAAADAYAEAAAFADAEAAAYAAAYAAAEAAAYTDAEAAAYAAAYAAAEAARATYFADDATTRVEIEKLFLGMCLG